MRKLLFFLLFFFCCGLMLGQAQGTGNYAFSTFDSRSFDSVNIGNLNVRFSIPIVSRTGRGLPFNYALQYEGLIWSYSGASGTNTWAPDPAWGFQGVLNGTGMTGYLTHRTSPIACPRPPHESRNPPPTQEWNGFTYHDQFGAAHTFNYDVRFACADSDDDDTHTGDGTSTDGSGYALNTENLSQVLTRSGQVITPPQSATGQDAMSVVDSNGNEVNGNASGTFTDTLGATALTITGSNPRTFTYPVTLQANGDTTEHATLSYKSYTVQTEFQCPNIVEYGATTVALPDRLTFVDGSYYQFGYEATPGISGAVTGRLAFVTLPTGGTISYAYSGGCSGAGINADGTGGTLTRTTSDGTRQYIRSPNNNSSSFTDVVDEKGNDTRYTFSLDFAFWHILETHRQVHQGNVQGPIIEDQSTCYNGSTCDGVAVTLPITEADVTLSFNGGTQSLTQNSYDPTSSLLTGSTLSTGGAVWTSTANSYNGNGEIRTSVQKDGNGTQYAGTTYNYDESTPTPTSGLPQHTAATGTRGNLTSVQVSTGSTTLNSSRTYYDTGQPVNSTAPDGGVTTYGYDGTQGFVTSTSLPTPSSGVPLGTSAQYDANTTALLSSTGMNADSTTINQYDALMRPTSMTLPSGSSISVLYNSVNDITAYQTLDRSRTGRSDVLLDGYGRVSQTAKLNGQSSNQFYQGYYCYDSTGLLQFRSSPYQSFGWSSVARCSGSGTAYQYDALGRVTSVTNDDGTASTTYQNRAVQTTDVNGISKITQYDIMGRVTGVCEISSTSYGGQSPTPCGMDIPGTGYVTSYSYNLSTHTTTVTQGGQTRTFTTDWIGRPTSTTEPERGTTTFSYAYSGGNGLQVNRTRPRANQTDPNTTTTTTTQYDTLGRRVSVTYNDNWTPWKNFYYDVVPASQGWTNTSPTNLNGRLAAMSTTQGMAAQYSYDVSGNVLTVWQCITWMCGNSNQQNWQPLQYTYDLSGALATSFDQATQTLTYNRSVAGEITSVTENLNDANNPPNLVSNLQPTVNGPASWTFGNGIQAVRTYDGLGRNVGIFDCYGSNQSFCGGGSFAYGNAVNVSGAQVSRQCDATASVCEDYSYDDLNRLTGVLGDNNAYSFGYGYDRWGNRLTSNGITYSINSATNQQTTNGYDAAGNQITDASHSYIYDAEGNVVGVDGFNTAGYAFDALNRRVVSLLGNDEYDYSIDPFGRKQSTYHNHVLQQGRIYWDYGVLAHREGGVLYFHHRNYLGTDRMRSNPAGQIVSTQRSGPFGENFSQSVIDGNAASDTNAYTGQDHDSETNTEYFQYRQYAENSGRWMSPDPYNGSYHPRNPQSFNRYAYVKNNPLGRTDQNGLDDCSECDAFGNEDGGDGGGDPDCPVDYCASSVIYDTPIDPDAPIVTEADPTGETLEGEGQGPTQPPAQPKSPVPPHSCLGFCKQDPNPTDGSKNPIPNNNQSSVWSHWPFNGSMFPMTPGQQDGVCTTGPMADPMNANPAIKSCCRAHDVCYAAHGCNATTWIPFPINPTPPSACSTCNATAAACITKAVF